MGQSVTKQTLKTIEFLKDKPGYVKKSKEYLSTLLNVSLVSVTRAKEALKTASNKEYSPKETIPAKGTIERKKRLYFDIETSPNVVLSWSVGHKINLSYDNIIRERAVICVCWKWEGESEVHSLSWNKGDDKQLLKSFITVMCEADELVGHNGDNFDIKWLRARAIKHGIKMPPTFSTIDTLKQSRQGFRFNSNRLDYIGKYLGLKGKEETGYDLWKDIVLNNCKASMDKMVSYCKRDVVLLEKVHAKLNPYTKHKYNYAVANGGNKVDCPECGSTNTRANGNRYTAAGTHYKLMQCNSCHKNYSVAVTIFEKYRR